MIKPDRGHPKTRCKGRAAEKEGEAFHSFGAGANTLCTPVFTEALSEIACFTGSAVARSLFFCTKMIFIEGVKR